MKATGIMFVLIAVAMAVLAAQPVGPAAVPHAASYVAEPIWMLLSGAALLALASAVRRYVPDTSVRG